MRINGGGRVEGATREEVRICTWCPGVGETALILGKKEKKVWGRGKYGSSITGGGGTTKVTKSVGTVGKKKNGKTVQLELTLL